MNTTKKIREKIENLPKGQPVTTREFLQFGPRASVDQALSRFVKAGVLSRPVRGVYLRPKINPYVGEVPPEPIKVAKAIAKNEGAVVQVHGAEALRQMGLSTQAPVKPIFYTSGNSRKFSIGNLEVIMKKVSQRKLALAGQRAGVALTALWSLGKERVTVATIEKIRDRLSPREFESLRSTTSMPGWMNEKFLIYEKGLNNG